jgi:non-heme chloroperoxidase
MGRCVRFCIFVLLISSFAPLCAQPGTSWKDPSPHNVQFVSVEPGVRLEVLDWGGTGSPVVLLAGGGNTAHVFDDFAREFTAHDHVYGITRRGFGASGYAPTDDPADRLGEDVLAAIDALNLKRPVLVGHSIAGAEMSWMASHHPDRVAGLVYLDAGYPYAFDNGSGANMAEIMKLHAPQPPDPSASDLASFDALQRYYERIEGLRFPEAELRAQWEANADGSVGKPRNPPGGAMLMKLIGEPKKYTAIPAPALFIFGNPHSLGTWVDGSTDLAVRKEAQSHTEALSVLVERQIRAVKQGLPEAQVVTIRGANHYVFLSNEAEVVAQMRSFVARLRRNVR